MNILFIGDVVGSSACENLRKKLPELKMAYSVDTVIVNGENSADGNGITPYSAKYLLDSGADVITTGNHCFKRKEMDSYYETSDIVLRPVNYSDDVVGRGFTVLDRGAYSLAVINLMGSVFMNCPENPFVCIDRVLEQINTKNIIVDFHAEATSEKMAMGHYLAGRVSAVIGTHTHVQTADEEILGGHTGYISDAGMTGVTDSVLGIKKEIIINNMLTGYPARHEYAEGVQVICGAVISVDEKTGICHSIQRIKC
ncbi:MAG: YmdB family metallophosphoesterase [Eubacterium sp.]|nr:YmdB family metallophosphoesterase [Eubacterium sp.]